MLVFQWVWSHSDDDDEAVCAFACDPDESVLQVSPRPFVEPPTCARVNRVVVFFVALELISFSLSYLLTARNGSVFFLLGSLPSARRAIVCILFSLEQSRVVDRVVAEVLLHLS